MFKDTLLRKKTASGRNLTHHLSVMRQTLYHCAPTRVDNVTNLSISEASKADPGVMPPSALETVSTPLGSKSLESDLGWSSAA